MDINSLSRGVVIAVLLLLPSFHFLAAAEGGGPFYWWNGSEKVELKVIPDYLIEFPSPIQSGGGPSDSLKILSATKLSGGAKLIQVRRSDFERAFIKNGISSSTPRSPLFMQGRDLKALPGGVILTFKATVAASEAQGYLVQQGLILLKKISLEGQPIIWLVQSAVGMPSLKLANSLFESSSRLIEKAQPNFWQPLDTRELRSIQLNPRRSNHLMGTTTGISLRGVNSSSGKDSSKKVYKLPYREQP